MEGIKTEVIPLFCTHSYSQIAVYTESSKNASLAIIETEVIDEGSISPARSVLITRDSIIKLRDFLNDITTAK